MATEKPAARESAHAEDAAAPFFYSCQKPHFLSPTYPFAKKLL